MAGTETSPESGSVMGVTGALPAAPGALPAVPGALPAAPGVSSTAISGTWQPVSKWTPWSSLLSLWFFVVVAGGYIAIKRLEDTDSPGIVWGEFVDLLRSFWLIAVGIAVVVTALTGIVAAIQWRHMAWMFDADGVHMRSGVLFKQHRHVRWDRIQSVDVTQKLLARLVRQASLTITSGGEKVEIGWLALPHAEKLRPLVLSLADKMRSGDSSEVPDLATVSAPEVRPHLYAMSARRFLASLVLSPRIFLAILTVAGSVTTYVLTDAGGSFALLFLIIALIWQPVSSLQANWGARISPTAEGVEKQEGLLSRRTLGLPSYRVHALAFKKPNLWPGWWKVESCVISGSISEAMEAAKTANDALVPVGTVEDVLAVVRELGFAKDADADVLPEGDAASDAAAASAGATDAMALPPHTGVPSLAQLRSYLLDDSALPGFIPNPRSSRWLDPIGWKRSGIFVGEDVIIMRHGWFWYRKVTILLREHYQSAIISQGPLERRFQLGTLRWATVGLSVDAHAKHMDAATASRVLTATVRERGHGPRGWHPELPPAGPTAPPAVRPSAPPAAPPSAPPSVQPAAHEPRAAGMHAQPTAPTQPGAPTAPSYPQGNDNSPGSGRSQVPESDFGPIQE
ncbi:MULTISPECIES: PH domain-containing protein [Actinotignum]|uniref:PH domain-containing protein n=1 Tax=Actinotignum TaxID=1653174 RepID=UPI00254C1914|nr:PH domain-containing protein [Actinotignum schaalii]MDE1536874.1 PH domain-containing protein [Actinotignum schaalii]MDK7271819.1 PH domain-containing protein [Actinotignum schaalii]